MFKKLFIVVYSFIVLSFSNYSYSNNNLFCSVSDRFNYLGLQQGPLLEQQRPFFVQRPQNVAVQDNQDESHWTDYVCCPATVCCAYACCNYPCPMASCSVLGCCACVGYTGLKCIPPIISLVSHIKSNQLEKME